MMKSKTRPEFLNEIYSPYKEVYAHILLDKNVKWRELKNDANILDNLITKETVLKLTALHPIFFLNLANDLEASVGILEDVKESLTEQVKIELNAFLYQR